MITTATTGPTSTRSLGIPLTRVIDDTFDRVSRDSTWTDAAHAELVRLASIASGALPEHARPSWTVGPDEPIVVVLRALQHLRTLAARTGATTAGPLVRVTPSELAA